MSGIEKTLAEFHAYMGCTPKLILMSWRKLSQAVIHDKLAIESDTNTMTAVGDTVEVDHQARLACP